MCFAYVDLNLIPKFTDTHALFPDLFGMWTPNIEIGGVSIETVVQKLGSWTNLLIGKQIDCIIAAKHGLSSKVGVVVVETSVQKLRLGLSRLSQSLGSE